MIFLGFSPVAAVLCICSVLQMSRLASIEIIVHSTLVQRGRVVVVFLLAMAIFHVPIKYMS